MDKNRVHANIDLDAVVSNLSNMKKVLPGDTLVACVLKTDAYGHGVVPIAKTVTELPFVWGLCVATVDEALDLRSSGIEKPILILGYTFPESYEEIIKHDLRPAILSYDMALAYSKAAKRLSKEVFCHIKLDTGMGRIGFSCKEDALSEIEKVFSLKNIHPEGIFTHFARADEAGTKATDRQFSLFTDAIGALEKKGISFDIRHCANSAAAISYPKFSLDMVRAGITMYGLWPSSEVDHGFPLTPVLSLYSSVSFIKTVEKGATISYGGTFEAPSEMVIATIPVGYGDGYARSLSNKGSVLIRGKRAPILGRICMDQFMVDITDIPGVSVGDTVTLVGRDGDDEITLEELGELSQRFNYEFACCLGNRIPRLYYRGGKLVDTVEYL
ncbi:MAG: alanine racemase [Lachnospiraceae bacterium]|nr:alanine racemase [Lachnospiraceae bacterium]